MAIIRLYGDLQRFGRVFRLDVSTPCEAIRALSSQIRGFREALLNGHFRVRIRRQDISRESLETAMHCPVSGSDVFHLVPVVQGAKNGGLFNVVVGAALVVSAFYTGGASIAAWGTWSVALGTAGASMILSGAATMLTSVSTPSAVSPGSAETSKNTSFSSLDNRVAQGACVPLIYGTIKTGSVVLSQELETV